MALCQTGLLNPPTTFRQLQTPSLNRSAPSSRSGLGGPLTSSVCHLTSSAASPISRSHAGRGDLRFKKLLRTCIRQSDARGGCSQEGRGRSSYGKSFSHCVGSAINDNCRSVLAGGFDPRATEAKRRNSTICCSNNSFSDSALEDPPSRDRPAAPSSQPRFDGFEDVPVFDSPLQRNHEGISSFDSPGRTLDEHIPPFEDVGEPARVARTPGLDDPALGFDRFQTDGRGASSGGHERQSERIDDVSRLPVPQAVAGAKPAPVETLEDEALDQGGLWEQAKKILAFAGPALGIWLGNPTMSLVDTAVIGTASSLELAALGPGTAVSDGFGHLFMFLSVATSNLIATAIAEKDSEGAARSLSRALFIALVCGVAITAICETLHTPLLKAFVGKNIELIPAARVYVQIRGLAWPAVLVTMVAQSACLGMQDAWGPLRVLVVSASVNCLGDILLCSVFKMGIAGAAWATAASQIVGCVLMLQSLRKRSTIPLYLSVPRVKDLLTFMSIAGPTLVTMFSKVSFYTLMTYICTAHGTATGAGHQVMIGLYAFFAVFGEPLCQTAQAFIPAYIRGVNRSLHKARKLLQSLVIMGGLQGLVLGAGAGLMPWVLPQLFSNDAAVIDQMRRVSVQIFIAVVLTPINLSMEGTLLAGRDLVYLAISMVVSFSIMASALLVGSKRNINLGGIWWCLVGFQTIRFISASSRLSNPKSVVGGLRTRKRAPEPMSVVFGK